MTHEEKTSISDKEHQRLVALGQIAGELIHDMTNLVAVVRGRASLALGEAHRGRPALGELERLVETADDLAAMLRDVMDVLAEKGLSPEVSFDPHVVVERVIERFLDTAPPVRIRLTSSLSPDLQVPGRTSFFNRVTSNLLANAARYANGEIEVTLSVQNRVGRDELLMTVEDDGPGIDAEYREVVFQPLVTGEAGRTGLGLSSVGWAVAQLGGEIYYRTSSSLGGACFEIHLPMRQRVRKPKTRLPESVVGTRLLLLEDDEDVRTAMARLLSRLGIETLSPAPTWHDEEDLLSNLLRARPDVIFVDLRLGAHSGLEVWGVLHAHLPSLARRVAFLSGLAPGDPEWDAARETGQPLLTKPPDLQEIASAIDGIRRGDLT